MVDSATNKVMGQNIVDQVLSKDRKKLSNEMTLDQVAQEFESLFVNQMLKSARSAKLAEGILDSEAHGTYQSLLDQEYSKTLAKNHNFGIAEGLIRQFGKRVNGN
jgi:peptidoglycan hydrolase FlgJ